MIIDTHAHMFWDSFQEDLDAVLQDGRYGSRLKLLKNDGRGNFSVENLLR